MKPTHLLGLRILTPESVILTQESLHSVSVPLADGGSIGIKPGHAPLIAETTWGSVHYQTEAGQEQIEIQPGVLDIHDHVVVILTAGEVSETPGILTTFAKTEFNRLRQTLDSERNPDLKKPMKARL